MFMLALAFTPWAGSSETPSRVQPQGDTEMPLLWRSDEGDLGHEQPKSQSVVAM
jgi:hypothetical protein